jgi:hypothetical protein
MAQHEEELDGLWKKIVEIHNHTKAHIIYCEEVGLDHKTFLQPRNELCNALEHIIRAKAFKLGMNTVTPDFPNAYEKDSLDKALGHEYRAFFDVCDWLAITLRTKIREALEKYPHDVISQVIPNYYSEIRPKLEGISERISVIRMSKDIKGDLLGEIRQYNEILRELKEFSSSLSTKASSLDEVLKGEVGLARKSGHQLGGFDVF